MTAVLAPHHVARLVSDALAEDLGRAGDLTTNAIVPADARLAARIVAREPGTIAGLALATQAFRALDPQINVEPHVDDGAAVAAGDVIARVSGNARAVLTGERVALNFLIHLSGIATRTRAYVEKVSGTQAQICCTRKTIPGLRAAAKYAVRVGGGSNHRFGLDDAVLIKDNHIAYADGDILAAVARARAAVGHLVKIEVEVDTLDQLEQLLRDPVDVVMLDNMAPDMLRQAVARVDGRMLTEASGGVTLETVRAIAESGVDLISVGGLTHSAAALDLGLDIAPDMAP